MEQKEQQAPAMTPEQAADLAELQGGAAEQVAHGAEEPAAPGLGLAGELKALTLAFVAMASPIFPSLGRIYTEQTTEAATNAAAAVCIKHGWLQDGVMGEWGEEIAAAVVILPLAFATVQGVKGDLAEARAKQQQIEGPGKVHALNDKPQAGPVAGFGPVQPAEGAALEN